MCPNSLYPNSAPNSDNWQGAIQDGPADPQYQGIEQVPIVAPTPSPASRWANIPAELRALPRWAVAGADKRPLTVSGGAASSTDPGTWADFESVCAAAQTKGLGIGFMLGGGYACIDLDVKDDTPQADLARHQQIVERFDSYTERSRSGEGRHIWIKAEIGKGKRRDGVELYSQERFIICTGDVRRAQPIQSRQKWAEELACQLANAELDHEPLPSLPATHSDEEVLRKARAAGNGEKFSTLYDTSVQETGESEGDLALITQLAFHSPNNEQVERLFMASARAKRPKVQTQKGYVLRTIETARKLQANDAAQQADSVAHGKDIADSLLATYEAKQQRAREARKSRFRLHTVEEIVSRPPMRWWVKGVIPMQGIGSIYGQPGSGKSFLAIDLLAAVQKGDWWFGYRTKHCPVVYLALEGQGGLCTRLKAYTQQKGHNGIAVMDMAFDIRGAEQRADLIEVIRDAGLAGGIVCLDTLAASAAGMEENSSADMGEVIEGMKEIQRELDACVLFVHHAGKNGDKGMRGHSSLLGAVDFAIEVTREEKGGKRTWRVAKSKDGEGNIQRDFRLSVATVGRDEDGEPIDSCYIDTATTWSDSAEHKPDAIEQDAIDELAVWDYMDEQCKAGKRPSYGSCRNDLNRIKIFLPGITVQRARHAAERLVAQGRLHREGPNVNSSWLRTVGTRQ